MTPEEWEVTHLDDCVPSGAPICYGILMPGQHYAGGVPVVKVRDIFDGRIDESDLLLTHPSIDGAYRRSRLAAGDLLITIRGTTGRVALTPPTLSGANITQDTARVRVKDDLSSEFVYFALQSEQAQQQIALHTIGQAVKGINIRDVRRLTFPIPKKEDEQRAIAGALSDVDALLAGLDRLIAKKRDLKQAAMQQLLTGQSRLSGFRGHWQTKRLAEIAPLQRGFDLPNSKLRNGTFPVVYSNGVLAFHTQSQVEGPGVVTGRSGTIGKVTFVEGPFWPHNTALWVTSFKGNDPQFVFYLYTRLGFDKFATGSGVPTLNRNDVHAHEVEIPPTKEEQTAIAFVLTEMDREISALEARRDKTRTLKQAMMQELLTGRIRLV